MESKKKVFVLIFQEEKCAISKVFIMYEVDSSLLSLFCFFVTEG